MIGGPAPEEAKPEAHKQGGVNLEALKQLESQEKGDDQPAEPEGEAPAEPQSEAEAAAEEAASEEADRVADAGSG